MNNEPIRISIAKDFSPVPAGPRRADGPKSGEVFREDLLLPKLRQAEKEGRTVEISLDGVEGIGYSFLQEAFGGLISKRHYTNERLKNLLRFAEHRDPVYPLYIRGIRECMAEAESK